MPLNSNPDFNSADIANWRPSSTLPTPVLPTNIVTKLLEPITASVTQGDLDNLAELAILSDVAFNGTTAPAHTFYGGDASGSGSDTPSFRALVSADIPNNAADTTGHAATSGDASALGGRPASTYAPLANPTFSGTVTAPIVNATSAIKVNGSVGAEGQVLQSNGVTQSWVTPDSSSASDGLLAINCGTADHVGTAYVIDLGIGA